MKVIGYSDELSAFPGDQVNFTVVRQGKKLSIPVELEQARN